MSEYNKDLAYSTSRLSKELLDIAERLDGSDAEWLKKAAERLSMLQSICRPSMIVKKAKTYSVGITTDDEGFDKTFFDVLMPFDKAIEFATKKFEKKGLAIQRIDIKRDDTIKEYEPYSENDKRFQS